MGVGIVRNGEKNRSVTASHGSAIQLVATVRELAAELSVRFGQSVGNDLACFLTGDDDCCCIERLACELLDMKSNILLGIRFDTSEKL